MDRFVVVAFSKTEDGILQEEHEIEYPDRNSAIRTARAIGRRFGGALALCERAGERRVVASFGSVWD